VVAALSQGARQLNERAGLSYGLEKPTLMADAG